MEELKQEHQVVRSFILSMPGEESKHVKQYQFVSWPDHGVPIDGFALLEYLNHIKREYRPLDGPMLVHCRCVYKLSLYIQANMMCTLL